MQSRSEGIGAKNLGFTTPPKKIPNMSMEAEQVQLKFISCHCRA